MSRGIPLFLLVYFRGIPLSLAVFQNVELLRRPSSGGGRSASGGVPCIRLIASCGRVIVRSGPMYGGRGDRGARSGG